MTKKTKKHDDPYTEGEKKKNVCDGWAEAADSSNIEKITCIVNALNPGIIYLAHHHGYIHKSLAVRNVQISNDKTTSLTAN